MTQQTSPSGSVLSIGLVGIVAIGFALMGFGALVDPQNTLDFFTPGTLSADMRNEVRAVYSGFGVAIAALLIATIRHRSLARGARIAVAIALLGMAAGRLVSLSLEPTLSAYPMIFFVVEVFLAALLLLSFRFDRHSDEDRA